MMVVMNNAVAIFRFGVFTFFAFLRLFVLSLIVCFFGSIFVRDFCRGFAHGSDLGVASGKGE
jgi:hypothetical protein